VLHFASGPLVYDRDDARQHKHIVAERFTGQGRLVRRLLEELQGTEGLFFEANAQVEMDRWSSGRVVLVGDAGYCAAPSSGRGASQALIGAYILAGELAAGGGHARAFAAYEREMRGFVAEHQQMGREGADQFFLGPPPREESGRTTVAPRTSYGSGTTLPASPRSGRHPAGLPADRFLHEDARTPDRNGTGGLIMTTRKNHGNRQERLLRAGAAQAA
jgi:2-polyprenyl-6-methoxyphenol hydroxylase-like FAD-dependent oxidoreductase